MSDTVSTLAQKLRPFWLRDLGASTPAPSGSSGMIAHALSGAYHTGTLDESQAPWAVTTTTFTTHTSNPDAHHARSHSITSASDHTVTGSQYQIVGLTGTNTLGLLTPASSPGANAVIKTDGSSAVTLVDLTVSSDLFVTGTLDFGTDTITEDSTYLQVAGSKPVRFGQNIGNANWTVYNAGGASFSGSVDIISGGDLTVAGSGSYAGSNVLFVDSSGGNVGIMRAPDSQFALDIAGPARADYWIGPHAIQLEGVLLLSHFDGRAPYETNYYGEPNGHMGQVATVSGGVIFRPGKFYKALQGGAGTTNLITNPSFETNTTGWDTSYAGTTSISRTAGGYIGSYRANVVSSGSPANFYSPAVTVSNNTTYSVSFYYAATAVNTVRVREYGTATNLSSESLSVTSEWTRYTKTVTTPSSGSTSIRIVIDLASSGTLYVDAVQIEQLGYASPYADGSLGGYSASGVPDGSAHAWTGTAHASTSTRSAAALTYPVSGNISASRGTMMAWIYADAWNTNGGSVCQAGSAWQTFDMFVSSTGRLRFYAGGVSLQAGADMAAGSWHHVAMTWSSSANARTIYVDGVNAGTTTYSTQTLDGDIAVGSNQHLGAAYSHPGLIDDFCILDRAISDSEIRAIYESNAPVFAESSVFVFRPTPKGLVWADDEGLWMRDSAGSPVLGAYGGDAATKSWAGFTMAAGDIVLGSNAVGSSAILWDKSAGTFGFYGAGSGTAQASVATDGSITAGAGALALNSSGIQITAPSTQTSIGAYKFLVTGKTITSGLYAYYISGTDTYYHNLTSDSSDIGNITTTIGSIIGGGGTVSILLALTNSLASTGATYTLAGGNTATLWIGNGDTNYVGIGTAAAPTRALQVNGGVFAGGEETGLAGYVQLTNSTQGVGAGTGTVKMNGATSRNSVGWLKLFSGTTAIYIPYWTTVTG